MKKEDIQQISVIGAGQMGHQIAMLCALGGYETILQDVHESALEKAESTLHSIMDKWVKKSKLTEEAKQTAFARLKFTSSLERAASHADFIIEAVVEKLDVKRELFARLDQLAKPHAILASNSSTIVNSLIASATNREDKVVNMHFFFPPLVMDCVEVVMSEKTSNETAELTMDVCKTINRTAVLLKKEISGFIANRILGALQREAVFLYEEGYASYEDIDIICRKALNHPIGPFELMDLSGIDVGYYVMQQRYAESGDPADKPFACIEQKVRQGDLGRKTGKGWYTYQKEEVKK
ncbi:3-hydroxyacyl-CoA dehydrogenase family protein [Metabacillus idriensis]|uniref:3-hydroxyacyl-CoA dehydrogenase family protein n=1 Tax=Metabacillus idriensis TaxID=324768 RepID=A0A6I2MAL1_9BACI|nr:3-hydroxyacyl-CoA dehydrogenase family protein [Metabacillus idriensis]MCM3594488.1 3-hydroxyacyl-CoA dehydrogenase family protein [Metabacillus idriensis]MRX53481.1 3-hydroxyacyl-CoA dehydrogenase family protein [Metabacillus idriensis]OHR73042.1 3-hydroxyacyl-CoA dehydrogenase [Bacillus sp. HMSC76G11]